MAAAQAGSGDTIWHPVLQTCRDEIAETCREPRYTRLLRARSGKELAGRVEAAAERQIEQIASKAGDIIMDGGDYWAALVLAADRILARER
jgi:hypothetical protein